RPRQPGGHRRLRGPDDRRLGGAGDDAGPAADRQARRLLTQSQAPVVIITANRAAIRAKPKLTTQRPATGQRTRRAPTIAQTLSATVAPSMTSPQRSAW